jgi:hypothetical protein
VGRAAAGAGGWATSELPATRILPGEELFFSHLHLLGGPAPVRRVLPELIDLIWNRQIYPARSST